MQSSSQMRTQETNSIRLLPENQILSGEDKGAQTNLLDEAKAKLTKSKLGFLGKTTERDLAQALEQIHNTVVQRYVAQITELNCQNETLMAKLEKAETKIAELRQKNQHLSAELEKKQNEVYTTSVKEEQPNLQVKAKKDMVLEQSMCSMLSMESAEDGVGAINLQRTIIDFASQMESLNRFTKEHAEPLGPVLKLSKSEKELKLINRNREILDKRDELLALQNVDVESSFASSRLPEEKRMIEKQIRVNLLDSLDRRSSVLDFLKNKTTNLNFLSAAQSEDIRSSVQVTENIQDSVVMLDVNEFFMQYTSKVSEIDKNDGKEKTGPPSILNKKYDSKIQIQQQPLQSFTLNNRVSKGIKDNFKRRSFISDNSLPHSQPRSGNNSKTANYMSNFKVDLGNYQNQEHIPIKGSLETVSSNRPRVPALALNRATTDRQKPRNSGSQQLISRGHGPMFKKVTDTGTQPGSSARKPMKDMYSIISQKGAGLNSRENSQVFFSHNTSVTAVNNQSAMLAKVNIERNNKSARVVGDSLSPQRQIVANLSNNKRAKFLKKPFMDFFSYK